MSGTGVKLGHRPPLLLWLTAKSSCKWHKPVPGPANSGVKGEPLSGIRCRHGERGGSCWLSLFLEEMAPQYLLGRSQLDDY